MNRIGFAARGWTDNAGGILYITGPADLYSKQNGPQPWYWSPL